MIKDNFVKDYLEKSLKDNWDLMAFSDYNGVDYKYSDVAYKISRIHLMFEECDVKKGDKIALLGKNSAHWAISYLAIVSYGAVVVPILPDFHANDVHHIVNHSDSVVLFTSDVLWDNLEESSMEALRAIISLTDFRLLMQNKSEKVQAMLDKRDELFNKKYDGELTPDKLSFPVVDNKDLMVINYTSGTTGFSKGVMLPANSLAGNVDFASRHLPLEPGNKIVSFLPLAHAYGCAFEFLWPFKIGCHITFLTKTPSPKIIMQAFGQIKPDLVLSVPLIIEKIYKKQVLPALNKRAIKVMTNVPILNNKIYQQINKKLSDAFGGNFKEIVIGGAALGQEVEDFLRKIKFPFTIGYGMTECGPLISYDNWDKSKPYSAGKILDIMEVRIDSGDPYNEVGEILIKGENLMYGYYKNEEATKAAIDEEGWLHTGDLGVIDEEGYIFIKGRSKSMILGPSGQNIYPEEIEAKINNMPFVQESLVIQQDNKLTALVYPDYDAVDDSHLSEHELELVMEENRKSLNQELPAYERITKFKLYPEEFEKTPKKSIKRFLYQIND